VVVLKRQHPVTEHQQALVAISHHDVAVASLAARHMDYVPQMCGFNMRFHSSKRSTRMRLQTPVRSNVSRWYTRAVKHPLPLWLIRFQRGQIDDLSSTVCWFQLSSHLLSRMMRRQLKAFLSGRKLEKAQSSSGEPRSKSQPQPTTGSLANARSPSAQSSSSLSPQSHRNAAIQGTSTPASASTPNLALKRAMECHIRELSDADRMAFTRASNNDMNQLLDSIGKLDDKHSQQSSFRKYTTRITNFLNIFQLSVGGASVFLQTESMASIALGGAKLVIGLALRYVEYFDKVSDMLDQLSKYLAPLSRYAEKCDLPNICDALADVYADILRFYSAARRMFVDETGNAKRYASFALFLRSQWTPFDAEFGEIKTSVQYHKDVLLHSGVSEILVNSSKSPKFSVED
jgi:hypothetical protein